MRSNPLSFGETARYFTRNAELFTRIWTDAITRILTAGLSTKADPASTPKAARQMRSEMFKAAGVNCDEVMRSPIFLDAIKQAIGTNLAMRKQMNDFFGRMQHDFQSATQQDVDQLMQVMNLLQSRMTNEFERLTKRIDDIAGKSDVQERLAKTISHVERAASKKRKSTTKVSAKKKSAAKKKITKARGSTSAPKNKATRTRRSKKSTRRRIHRVSPLPI